VHLQAYARIRCRSDERDVPPGAAAHGGMIFRKIHQL
jgi:hypothetical protein